MKYETFNFAVDEYTAKLTEQTHQTIGWLYRHDYIDSQVADDLLGRLVVVPIRNQPSMGERILARFFGKQSTENSYVFPLTLLEKDEVYYNDDGGEKHPTLKVVK